MDGNGVRSAGKKLIFHAEWLECPWARARRRRRCRALRAGLNFFNSFPRVERFDPRTAGAYKQHNLSAH